MGAGESNHRSLWPLTQLREVELGSSFDADVAARLNLTQDFGHPELELEYDVWSNSDQMDYFGVDVCNGRVIGVACHYEATVHGRDLIGIDAETICSEFGEPSRREQFEGELTFLHYVNGDVELLLHFSEDIVDWVTLHDWSSFENDPT
jgi:hypothetical protein